VIWNPYSVLACIPRSYPSSLLVPGAFSWLSSLENVQAAKGSQEKLDTAQM